MEMMIGQPFWVHSHQSVAYSLNVVAKASAIQDEKSPQTTR